jgi:hypothetical protein
MERDGDRGAVCAEHSATSKEKRGIRDGRCAKDDHIRARHTQGHPRPPSRFLQVDRRPSRVAKDDGLGSRRRKKGRWLR